MVLDTVHKQKSFVLTSIIMTLIILLLLVFRMSLTSIPPEQEGGIAITFGTDKVGRGEISPHKLYLLLILPLLPHSLPKQLLNLLKMCSLKILTRKL